MKSIYEGNKYLANDDDINTFYEDLEVEDKKINDEIANLIYLANEKHIENRRYKRTKPFQYKYIVDNFQVFKYDIEPYQKEVNILYERLDDKCSITIDEYSIIVSIYCTIEKIMLKYKRIINLYERLNKNENFEINNDDYMLLQNICF